MKILMWILLVTGDLLQHAPHEAALNPYAGNESARRAGRKLFERHCAQCHGAEGEGMGKAPALAVERVKRAEPGALLWVLRNGSRTAGMPSFSQLPDERLWQIVEYLQSGAAR